MELRAELMPPTLDKVLIDRLSRLAARLDGAQPGQWEEDLTEFNQLAGMDVPREDFQGIYKAEDHQDWVRRLIYRRSLKPSPELTRAEMVEIVSRVLASRDDRDFYLELFLVNCKHPSRSDLIFWPDLVSELPQGREPTAEEIAELAMRGSV
jgi:hypothetical protein